MEIPIRNTSTNESPQYMSSHAAGLDIRASLDGPLTLLPGCYATVPTGIHVAIPRGYEMQVRARSGLAFKHGIGLVNGVGTIDADYRGEIKVLLINHGSTAFTIEHGDRIAQLVLAKHEPILWRPVDSLDQTSRGSGGFGSTGVKV